MSKQEVNLGGGVNLLVKTAKPVTIWDTLTVTNGKSTLQLDVKIEADFDTVPEEYQEVFLNMMTSRYLNRASFGDNPFSLCQPAPKKRWYQFWKP